MINKEKIEVASSNDIKKIASMVSKSSKNYSMNTLQKMYIQDAERFKSSKWLIIKKNSEICGSAFIYSSNVDINNVFMHSFVIACEIKPSTLVSFYKEIYKAMSLDERPNPRLIYNEEVFSKGFIKVIRKKRHLIYKRFLESKGYKVNLVKRFRFWPFPILLIFILNIRKQS